MRTLTAPLLLTFGLFSATNTILLGDETAAKALALDVEKLLNAGDQLDLKNATDLVILLGSTNVGKSTLSRFITQDKSLLVAKIGSNFVFTDKESFIPVISKAEALLPKVYQNPGTEQIIVDCPGFSNARPTKYEIAASYYLKRVLEYGKRIKIVVVENQINLIESAQSRLDFMRLLKHLSELFPDIDSYRDSIALVVTKVSNRGISDEEEKAKILSFMSSFAKELRNLTNGNNETISNSNYRIIKALRVLQGDGSGNNIGLFRKPIQASDPWQSSVLQKCYQDVRAVIFRTTSWLDNQNNLYRYTLSQESVVLVKDHLAPNNTRNALSEVNKILSVFQAVAESKISASAELPIAQKLQIISGIEKQFLNFLNTSLETPKDIVFLGKNLSKILTMSGIDHQILVPIVFKAQFYSDVGGEDITQFIGDVKLEAAKTAKRLSDIVYFYNFLKSLETKIENYLPQSVRNASFRQIGVADFKSFISNASMFQIEISDERISETTPTEYMMTDLNKVMATSLNYQVHLEYDEQTRHLLVEARNLIVSEIKKELPKYPNPSGITLIAERRIFMDQNLTLIDSNLDLIASSIEVVDGPREILLAGQDAAAFASTPNFTGPPSDGHPGSKGGDCLLLADDVVRPDLLTVRSVGGRGGRGQDGRKGKDGVASSFPSTDAVTLSTPEAVVQNFQNLGYGVERSGDNLVVSNQKENVPPSNGENGAAGGPGGKPGRILVRVKNQASGKLIKTARVAGPQGEGGGGGLGGKGMAKCARKHYTCVNDAVMGKCGKLWMRKTCVKGWEYRCTPQKTDFCDNFPDGIPGNQGASMAD